MKKKKNKEIKIEEYVYVSNKNKLLINDKEEIEKMFCKYATHYIGYPEEERKKSIYRQRYVYDGLRDKELSHTNIEKLLDVTLGEMNNQENIMQNIDNKIGFTVAFFGILVGFVIQGELIQDLFALIGNMENHVILRVLAMILTGLIIIVIGILIGDVYRSLTPKTYQHIILDDYDYENFRVAVDDKKMALVALLENTTYAVSKNNEITDKKAAGLKGMITRIVILTILLVIAAILSV